MSETRVRVVFEGFAAGGVRASAEMKASLKAVGGQARDAAIDIEKMEKKAAATAREMHEMTRAGAEAAGVISFGAREATERLEQVKREAESGTRALHEERDAAAELGITMRLVGDETSRANRKADEGAGARGLGGLVGVMGRGASAAAVFGLGLPALGGALALAGGAAGAFTAALVPAIGVLAAAPVLLGAFGLAAGTAMLGLDGVSKALHGNKKALQELSPEARQFVTTLKSLNLEPLQEAAQSIFPGLTKAVREFAQPAILGPLTKAIGGMGQVLGNFAAGLGAVISNRAGAFSQLLQGMVTAGSQFSKVMLSGADAMITLAQAALPLTNWLGQVSVHLADLIDKQLAAAQASGKLASFFDKTRVALQQTGQLIGAMGGFLIHLLEDAYPAGVKLMGVLTGAFQAASKFETSVGGRNLLHEFFKQSELAIRAILPLLGQVLVGLVRIGTAAGPLIAQLATALTQVMPHLVSAIVSTIKTLQPLLKPVIEGLKILLIAGLDGLKIGMDRARPYVQQFVAWVRAHWPEIQQIVKTVVDYVRVNVLPLLAAGFTLVEAVVSSVVGGIRRDWPQIRPVMHDVATAVAAELKMLTTIIKDITPAVKALAPVFAVAFLGIATTVKVQAAIIEGVCKAIIAVINGVKSALSALGGAVHTVSSYASSVGGFLSHPLRREAGGLVPLVPGTAKGKDGVPAVLAPGEMVLTESHQEMLGGQAYLAGLFGFGGGARSSFETGGLVGGATKPPPPPRHKHPRATKRGHLGRVVARGEAETAGIAGELAQLDLSKQILDEKYNFLAQEFDLSNRNLDYILTDPTSGVESLNTNAVGTRTAQIHVLEGERTDVQRILSMEMTRVKEMLDLLNRLIPQIEAKIAELKKRIAEETKRINDDVKKIRELQDAIAKEHAAIATERAKKGTREYVIDPLTGKRVIRTVGGPDKDKIQAMEADVRKLENEKRATERDKQDTTHKRSVDQSDVSKLTSKLATFQDEQGQQNVNAHLTIPSAVDEVQLDLDRLNAELADLANLPGQIATYNKSLIAGQDVGGGGGFGDLGGLPLDFGVGSASVDNSGLIAQVGALKLALGIQNAQLPIIGAYETGTLHVPETGMALVHAGERITPAGVKSSGGERHSLHVTFGVDESELGRVFDARVANASERLRVTEGRDADRRRRGGRY